MFKYAQKVFEKVSALKSSRTPNLFRYTSGMGTTKRKTSGSSFRPISAGKSCTAGDSLRSGSAACSPHSKGISIATGESEATRTSIGTSARITFSLCNYLQLRLIIKIVCFFFLNFLKNRETNILKWFSCTFGYN